MQTIDQVQAAWDAMDRQGQLEAWDSFTRAIDYGEQGYHPFYLILWSQWVKGDEPFPVEGVSGLDVDDLEIGHDDFLFSTAIDQSNFDYLPF